MLTGVTENEHGTPVAEGTCDTCGQHYTVCPPPDKANWLQWPNCLSPNCASYDLNRDLDIFFEPLMEHGLIRRDDPSTTAE